MGKCVRQVQEEGPLAIPPDERLVADGGPGRIPAGAHSRDTACTMDLVTTSLKLAGGSVPADRPVDGHDISRTLLGSDPSPREEFYSQTQVCTIRSGSWKQHFREARPGEVPGFEPLELYNLDQDPPEPVNLLKENSKAAAQMAEQAKAFNASIKPGRRCPPRAAPGPA